MARPARAAGREPRDRPRRHQQRGLPGPLQAVPLLRAPGHGVLLGSPALRLRRQGGQAAPGGSGLPERLRRGRPHRRYDLRRGHRGAGGQLPTTGRHPGPPPPDGAGRLLQGVRREEAARGDLQRERGARQCAHAPRAVRGDRRPLYVRGLSRRGRPLHRAGQRDEPAGAPADSPPDAAAHSREGHVRAGDRACLPQRGGPAPRGPRPGPRGQSRLLGAVRRPAPEESRSSSSCG